MVLRGENVARAPANVCAESLEGLDQDSSLDGHVEGAGNASALERLRWAVLCAAGHETWHLDLGDLELLATKVGKRNISNLVVPNGRESGGAGRTIGWMG